MRNKTQAHLLQSPGVESAPPLRSLTKRSRSQKLLTLCAAVLGVTTAPVLKAGELTLNFNEDLGGAVLSGSARHRLSGGVNDSGYVSITDAVGSQQGGLTLPDVDAGGPAGSITVTFMLRIGGGTDARPADGFSFNIVPANDPVVNGNISEDGPGRGLTVSFDTWDNNPGPDAAVSAPVLQVFYNGVSLGDRQAIGVREAGRDPTGPIYTYAGGGGQQQLDLRTGNEFQPVRISYTASANGTGLLDVDYKGAVMFEDLPVNLPAGTYRMMMGSRTGGAWDNHWVDDFVITTAAPAFHTITGSSPGPNGDILGNANLTVNITDGTSGALDNGSVSATIDGTAVPAGNITFNKTGSTTTVTIDPPGDLPRSSTHTLVLTYGTGIGAETTTFTLPFVVSPLTGDTIFVETEDFDFDVGQWHPEAQAADYPGGAYATTAEQPHHAYPESDYNNSNTGGDDLANSNNYRLTEEPNMGMVANGDVARLPGFNRTVNYKVGWNDPGDWQNFTRNFPEGNYEVFGRIASGGAGIRAKLSVVQETNPASGIQVAGDVGTFSTANGTGGWDNFIFVPLVDGSGNTANIVLKGTQTVRFTTTSGGNNDNNYLAFIPVPASVRPAIVTVSPQSAFNPTSEVTFSVVIVEQTGVIDPATVRVTVDGTEIAAAGTAYKANQVITISGTAAPFGYLVTKTLTVHYNDGQARTANIQVTSGGGVVYKRFDGIGGVNVSDLTGSTKFRNNAPDVVQEVFAFEYDQTAPNVENFGGQLLAYFIAPATGDYQFNIAADDGAQFWISTDDQPLNKRAVARQPSWSGYREFATQSNGGALPAERVSSMIPLVAGQRYYVEAIYKEGGGGDNVAVAYRMSASTPWRNNDTSVPEGRGLREVVPFRLGFDRVPVDTTTSRGTPTTLSANVVIGGAGQATFQWYRAGVLIDGATSADYTFRPTMADNGVLYHVTATFGDTTLTSPTARLTVNDDTTAPTIESIRVRSFHELVVTMSEGLDAPDAAAFALNNGATISAVTGTTANPRIFSLTTSRLTDGTTYTLTAPGARDFAGNPATGSGTVTPVLTERFAMVEHYRGASGNLVDNLRAMPIYPVAPTDIEYHSTFEGGSNGQGGIWDNYGARVSGYFIPNRTGNVIAYISTDDGGELWMSTDDDPANKALIAREPVWNGVRSWLTLDRRNASAPENVSAPLAVTAGQRYYVELLFKEGGGGDNAGLTFVYDDEEPPANGSPALSGTRMGVAADGTGRSLTLNPAPPANIQVVETRSATISATAVVTPSGASVGYQWQIKAPGATEFTDVPGANSNSYTTAPLTLADDNTQYRLIAFTLGASVTSSPTTLDVIPDTFPPVPSASALRAGGAVDIGITFDEPVDQTSAATSANYSLSAGTIQSVTYYDVDADGPLQGEVVIRATGLTVGQTANVTVRNVSDVPFGNAIPAAGVTVPFTVGSMNWTGVGADELNLPEGVVAVGDNGFDVISGGIGQWSTYDESTFIYEQVTGDFDKKVRVTFQESSSQWARTGLMVREALDSGKPRLVAGQDPATEGFSRYQKVHVNPVRTAMDTAGNNAHELNRRTARGGETDAAATSNNAPPPYPNAWVRLKRTGDVLTMYRSDNGEDWTQLGSTTLNGLAAQVYVGPDYAPEVGNVTAGPLRRSFLARFRDYGNVGTPPPPTPTISLTFANGQVTVEWANGTLQSTTALGTPFTDVSAAQSGTHVESTSGEGDKFFRVFQAAP